MSTVFLLICIIGMLLSQLHVREFNDDSVFHDPCLSFVLRDVICPYCSSCRDMDLLRDLDLTQEDPSKRWLCQHCNHKINSFEIEDRLMQEIERQSIGFLLQDMRCPLTHIVSTRYSSSTSVLCKPLAMDISQKNLKQTFTTLLKVAKFHNFSLLESSIQSLSGH
jgi:DNA polymerase epsilon subunit 1